MHSPEMPDERDDTFSLSIESNYSLFNTPPQEMMSPRLNIAEFISSVVYNANSRNDHSGRTALHYAVSAQVCHSDVILNLLRNGADVNARCCHQTPLHIAVQNPVMDPEIIRALLSCPGADVNVSDGPAREFTPLHYAVGGPHCNVEIVKVLLEMRADVNKIGKGVSPIHIALLNHSCSLEIIRLLIQAGSSVSTMSKVGSPLFLLLCRPDCDTETIKLLLDKGADPNGVIFVHLESEFGAALEVLRCSYHLNSELKDLYCKCAIIDGMHLTCTPLLAGILLKNISPDDVELLLEYGADPNHEIIDGEPLLTHALTCNESSIPKLRVLLKHGAKFYDDPSDPEPPFYSMLCSQPKYLTLGALKAIMDYKENFDFGDLDGCTLLHGALDRNAPAEFLLFLIKYDIPPDEVAPCNLSSLHHAVQSSCSLHVIEFLLEQSACVDVRDMYMNTPLHLAGSRPEVVATLLRYGADATLVNSHSLTPFHLFFESCDWSFKLLENVVKPMVLNKYLSEGYFDATTFVDSILRTTRRAKHIVSQLKSNLIPFVQDCQSELGYACLDPTIFYLLVSRFSLKLHLKNGFLRQKIQIRKKRLYSIKEKMLESLHDRKLLGMITSNEYPIYEDFLLFLLNKVELSCIASELKIPLNTSNHSPELKLATPESILLVAEYMTLNDLSNLIFAFIKSSSQQKCY